VETRRFEQADQLFETVKTTGLKYMMFETSCFHADNYAMRQIYMAGGFGRLIYSEGEYYHYCAKPIRSYKEWRTGLPPLWYPTHSTAYYIGVTDKTFTSVSCLGFHGKMADVQPGGNKYDDNPFSDEIALFETSEGGTSRMLKAKATRNKGGETGRVFGELGWMNGMKYNGTMKKLPNLKRPPLPPGVKPGSHGGAHGHLTEEFVRAILEDRKPLVDVVQALNMTVPGVVAHQSALKGGQRMKVPQYKI
jgi:predicted dehydrogenase